MDVRGVRGWVRRQVAAARRRWWVVDRIFAALRHYGDVLGSQLAAGVTYYAFLSFFPIVALAFAAVGYVVDVVPDAGDAVRQTLQETFPGLVGGGPGQIDVGAIASRRAGVGLVGLAGLLYSGLGWVSALRTALRGVFAVAGAEGRNLVVGKLVDLLTLAVIGVVLVFSVSLGTALTGFVHSVAVALGAADLPGSAVLLRLAGVVVGLAANSVLFFLVYTLLPGRERVPPAARWQGAVIAAVGFEVLKQLAGLVIGQVTGNPLYGAFAILVALLVWINYFSRLVVLGACWAASGLRPAAGPGVAAPAPARNRGRRAVAAVAGVLAVGWLVGRRRAAGR